MFRFSERFHRHALLAQRSRDAIEEARHAMERERRVNRRWRMRHPERKPDALVASWKANKEKTAREYSQLMVSFTSMFDGVSEANQMMRHGLEANDLAIPLEEFEGLAQKVFDLRLFEIFAEQAGLSQYTRELILQRLVPQTFPGTVAQKANRGFDMAITELRAPEPPQPRKGRRS